MRADVFGYFDGIGDVPAHDPGMGGKCPVCALVLERPVKTISLMPVERNGRSYFFRVHKACWESASEDDKSAIESSLIDEVCGIPGAEPSA